MRKYMPRVVDNEIYAIIRTSSGAGGAIEIKLGADYIDKAAKIY